MDRMGCFREFTLVLLLNFKVLKNEKFAFAEHNCQKLYIYDFTRINCLFLFSQTIEHHFFVWIYFFEQLSLPLSCPCLLLSVLFVQLFMLLIKFNLNNCYIKSPTSFTLTLLRILFSFHPLLQTVIVLQCYWWRCRWLFPTVVRIWKCMRIALNDTSFNHIRFIFCFNYPLRGVYNRPNYVYGMSWTYIRTHTSNSN